MLNPTIRVIPLKEYPLEQLEQEWTALFAQSAGCFFLSWNWINSWLSILPNFDNVYVVRATRSCLNDYALDDLLGFGIFCETKVRRHGFVTSKQWHLHRTGSDKLDQIWIEYNDFLLAETVDDIKTHSHSISSQQIRTAIWQSLLSAQPQTQSVDEFVVNVAKADCYKAFSKASDLNLAPNFSMILDSEQLGFKVALNASDIENYPLSLSKSSYKQINKTRTELEKQGRLEIEYITDVNEITASLTIAKAWHIDKWRNSNTPSGFCNEVFIQFHHDLCQKSSGNTAHVACVVARLNNKIIGLNYLFVDHTAAYFYLSCLAPQDNSRIKLGLLLHQESVKYAESCQLTYYDFLAGQSRYKQQLSNSSIRFARCIFQRKKLRFTLESILATAKSYLVRK